MAAINVRSEKHKDATFTGDVRIGRDLVVEGTITGGFSVGSFTNLTITGTLTANIANITTLNATTGTITTLNSTTATIGTLNATTGTITTLNSTTGTITTLNSTTATITNLTVSNNLTLGGVANNGWVWVRSAGTRSGEGTGTNNTASGTDSLAFGTDCTVNASAQESFAFGNQCVVNAAASVNGTSFVGGFQCTGSGRGTIVYGRNCTVSSFSCAAFGQSCTIGTTAENGFVCGNASTIGNGFTGAAAMGLSANAVHGQSYVWGCGANNNLSTGGLGSGNTNTLSQATRSFNVSATGGAFFGLAGANFVVDGAVVAVCDENLKEDVSDFSANALNAINNIQIRRYKRKVNPNMEPEWINDYYKYEIGFFNSDLPAILKTGPNDRHVNTLSCIGAIFKALQEIRAFQLNLRQDVDSILDILNP